MLENPLGLENGELGWAFQVLHRAVGTQMGVSSTPLGVTENLQVFQFPIEKGARLTISTPSLLSKAVPRFPGVCRSRLAVTLTLPPSVALGQPPAQQTPPFHLCCPSNSQGRPGNHLRGPAHHRSPTHSCTSPSPQIIMPGSWGSGCAASESACVNP